MKALSSAPSAVLQGKRQPPTRWNFLSRRPVIFAVCFVILVPLFGLIVSLVFWGISSGSASVNSSMINLHNENVLNLSESQMNALLGLKFSQTPSQDPSYISRDRLPNNCRVIPPGSMVTMDFQEDRLNVHLDSEGKIKKVKKG